MFEDNNLEDGFIFANKNGGSATINALRDAFTIINWFVTGYRGEIYTLDDCIRFTGRDEESIKCIRLLGKYGFVNITSDGAKKVVAERRNNV